MTTDLPIEQQQRRAERGRAARVDAERKASGASQYVGDMSMENMAHIAVARSTYPRARIRSIDKSAALASPGVVGVYTAADITAGPYGRITRDVPILARDEVRFVGERVAAVVAESRLEAEQAAALIEIDYEELPPVTNAAAAFAPGAPVVDAAPWLHPAAAVKEGAVPNLQGYASNGEREVVEAALAASTYTVDRTYRTQAVHHAYLEPQACIAEWRDDRLHVWLTSKSPYAQRTSLAACLGIEEDRIEIEGIEALGGDFGGKGSPQDAPLCAEMARLAGRPVKIQLRYAEDLIATEVRHPVEFRVRLGCDASGALTACAHDVVLDGGAYVGFKFSFTGTVGGIMGAPGYRIPAFFVEARTAYTNTLPKGSMRAPGGPQVTFAFECALDELALEAGLEPAEIRRRNLLVNGDKDPNGHEWLEFRGLDALEAALEAIDPPAAPEGWLTGRGLAVHRHGSPPRNVTSMCLVPLPEGRIRVETPIVETGTGSHTVIRELIGRELGFEPEDIDVVHVSTDELDPDSGALGSRVTSTVAVAVDQAVKAWLSRIDDGPVKITVDEPGGVSTGSFGVQVAEVAVDPETGQLKVLEILSVIDVAEIVNEIAHQAQIDGGTVMGFGYACLEDLDQRDGQVWSANLGELKLPTARDVPSLRTVLVRGGRGVGTANVKSIGEMSTPPTAAAIANAVANATGRRVRELPLSAERVFAAMSEPE